LTRSANKIHSIYFQLVLLLTVSAVTAGIVFLALETAGVWLIDNYYDTPEYNEKKNRFYIEKMQQYIDEEQISYEDRTKLNAWVKEQQVISVRVYKNNTLMFNSDYQEQEPETDGIYANENDLLTYYPVEFADGTAMVGIIGWYVYQLYNYEQITALVASFLLFLVLTLLGIRRKMAYIARLSMEIGILEGGSLDYKITVTGQDELSRLAQGLDNMRRSFKNMIAREAEMVRENQKVVTEMSHDLRTPVTSILLYTEILKKGNYESTEQSAEYLDKIDRQARRMKQLTDHLFEYSLVSGQQEITLEKAESYEDLFYDLLSETCSFLEHRGFHTVTQMEWRDQKLRVCTEYVVRIMDNITSNILKYADAEKPVKISSMYIGQMAGFAFENSVQELTEKPDSTRVGLQSIKNMMQKMGGISKTCEQDGIFRIEVLFPCMK
jgi:signal transduction histidine kinase